MTNRMTRGKAAFGAVNVSASGLSIAGTAVTATAAEFNKVAGVTAGTSSASKAAVLGANKNLDVLAIADGGLSLGAGAGTVVTATAAELNKLHSTGAGAPLRTEIINFAEATASATVTGTVTIPAGGFVYDVILHTSVQWNAGTSAAMSVGDADSATGYINAVNVKTQTADTTGMGGISNLKGDTGAGGYIGKTKYYASGGTITASCAKVGAGTLGRSQVIVLYSVPTAQTAA